MWQGYLMSAVILLELIQAINGYWKQVISGEIYILTERTVGFFTRRFEILIHWSLYQPEYVWNLETTVKQLFLDTGTIVI